MSRHHYNTWTRITAIVTSPSLYELADGLDWEAPVGRPRANPAYVVLAYGLMARLARSAIRVELDLQQPHTWHALRQLMIDAVAAHGFDLPPPGPRPPTWSQWRWMRDHHLTTDEGLATLARVYPTVATAVARRVGLLNPHGPGSLTHPDRRRAVYGDGTQVRPLYRPPETVTITQADDTQTVAFVDPRTGHLLDLPPGRYDPDLLERYGRHGAESHGYVAWHTRGPRPYQRVDLAVGHIREPGAEAATAVDLLGSVHRTAGAGVQLVVYDGALRGTHIDHIMRRYGYLVLAKVHADATTDDPDGATLVKTPQGRRARSLPLGTVSHQLPTGPCVHQIAAAGGRIVEIDLDETGDPVIVSILTRTAVKRSRRATGQYHFNVGYQLNCPAEPFTTWLNPHADSRGDSQPDTRRPEQLRIITPGDPDAIRIGGLRSDAESFHSHYKRTLIVDRAMSLGWRRGLIDLYCFCSYSNALTEYRAQQESQGRRAHEPFEPSEPPRPKPPGSTRAFTSPPATRAAEPAGTGRRPPHGLGTCPLPWGLEVCADT